MPLIFYFQLFLTFFSPSRSRDVAFHVKLLHGLQCGAAVTRAKYHYKHQIFKLASSHSFAMARWASVVPLFLLYITCSLGLDSQNEDGELLPGECFGNCIKFNLCISTAVLLSYGFFDLIFAMPNLPPLNLSLPFTFCRLALGII